MQPMQVARYLYFVMLIPAASAVAGLSPTALRFRPVLVLRRKYAETKAMMMAAYARNPYDRKSFPNTPALEAKGRDLL